MPADHERMQIRFGLGVGCACVLLLSRGVLAADWPRWRGVSSDGTSTETGLPDHWTPDGENMLWRASLVHPTASPAAHTDGSPTVAGGRVYLMNSVVALQSARTLAFDALTGSQVWEFFTNVYQSAYADGFDICPNNQGSSTPTVGGGMVCNTTKEGRLQCFDQASATANRVWVVETQSDLNVTIHNCANGSPLIYGNTAIFSTSAGRGTTATATQPKIVARNLANGAAVWGQSFNFVMTSVQHGSWSTPILINVMGQDQIVYAAGNARVYGLDPANGNIIWSFDTGPGNGGATGHGIVASPVYVNGRLIVVHGEDPSHTCQPGMVFAINPAGGTGDITNTGEVWRYAGTPNGLQFAVSSPLVVGNVVYVADMAGDLYAIDFNTGQLLGSRNLNPTGCTGGQEDGVWASPTFGDGKMYVGTSVGDFFILGPDANNLLFTTLDQDVLDGGIHASAAIANGVVYVPSRTTLYALQDGNAGGSAGSGPAGAGGAGGGTTGAATGGAPNGSGSGGSGANAAADDPTADSGCGCRAAAPPSRLGALMGTLALLALGLWRRRR